MKVSIEAQQFINEEVQSVEDAIKGAQDIIVTILHNEI